MTDQDELYRQVVGASVDGLWLVDPDGRTLLVNERVAELLGYTAEELAGLSVGEVFASPWWATDAGAVDVQRVHRRPDGSEVPLLVSERTLLGAEGEVIGRLHQIVDDRRRWTLLDEFRRSQSQLADAQSIARLGSWEARTAPLHVTWSHGMYEVLGLPRAGFDPAEDTFTDMVVDADRATALEARALLASSVGRSTTDVRVRRGDGEVRWVRVVGEVLERGADGRPVRFGGTVQDVHTS